MMFCDGSGRFKLVRAVVIVMGFLIGWRCKSPISIRYRGQCERDCLAFTFVCSIFDERGCLASH